MVSHPPPPFVLFVYLWVHADVTALHHGRRG